MTEQIKCRVLRVVDFVAELLEAQANRLPPSQKESADMWRKAAADQRGLDNPRLTRVWEVTSEG